jgi:ATP/maltotriose-dependent transcriptional regulator MalT
MVIHCYVYWKGIYVRDSYELENIVMELNNAFTEPLKETEIRAILRSVPKAIDKFIAYEQGLRCGERKRVSKGMRDKEGYWYKNDTLIERLDISTSEQKHMKTMIGVDEKYDRNNERRRKSRRNEEGLTKREKEKLDTINELRELVNKGLKNKDIAEKLSISVRQVQRLKQEI